MAKHSTQIDIQLDEPVYEGELQKRYNSLIELREQLVDQVEALSGANLANDHNAGEDMADIGSDNFLREMGLTVASEEGRKVFLIQEALKRLDTGEYGKCVDCSVDIAPRRLDAIPYAKLCIKCKARREENGTDHMNIDFGINQSDEITE